jgi:hypothetical protein
MLARGRWKPFEDEKKWKPRNRFIQHKMAEAGDNVEERASTVQFEDDEAEPPARASITEDSSAGNTAEEVCLL